jgi:hypothetical protein
VGWYRNARVFRERQYSDRFPTKQHRTDSIKSYRIRARASDAEVLRPDSRSLRLKRGKGWMGHAQWWFPHLHVAARFEIKPFVEQVLDTVGGYFEEDEQDEIISVKKLTRTQKKMLQAARIGQGDFRNALRRSIQDER